MAGPYIQRTWSERGPGIGEERREAVWLLGIAQGENGTWDVRSGWQLETGGWRAF